MRKRQPKIKPKSVSDPRESDIQASICAYLALKKHLFWRSNNVPVFDSTRDSFRALPKYTMRGLPDITVIKDGWYIGLEVKRAHTQPSPAQKDFAAL
ncbi:MAG: hypothetical protein KGJ13_13205, partial [Patescibacteria group bacterium]|nr:hypothetical protein [Patescibacteria group bacterium]